MKISSFFILLFFAFCSVQLNAQKCKYDLDKTDPMTNERVRRITFSIKSYFLISIFRKTDDYRVELNVRFGGERNFKVLAGEKIDLKLADGTILTLSAAQDANPVSYAAPGQVMTIYAVSYNISQDEMKQISENGFTVVKVKLGGEELTYETRDKTIPKTAAGAKCILSN